MEQLKTDPKKYTCVSRFDAPRVISVKYPVVIVVISLLSHLHSIENFLEIWNQCQKKRKFFTLSDQFKFEGIQEFRKFAKERKGKTNQVSPTSLIFYKQLYPESGYYLENDKWICKEEWNKLSKYITEYLNAGLVDILYEHLMCLGFFIGSCEKR